MTFPRMTFLRFLRHIHRSTVICVKRRFTFKGEDGTAVVVFFSANGNPNHRETAEMFCDDLKTLNKWKVDQ